MRVLKVYLFSKDIMETTAATMQSVNVISNSNFEREVLSADKPVLLLCMSGGRASAQQTRVLERVSGRYGDAVEVCRLEEELINGFRQMYAIKGTPIFLLLQRGRELGRMLGLADVDRLQAFLDQHLALAMAPGKGDRPWP